MAVAGMPAGWLGWVQEQVTTKAGTLGSAVATNFVLPVNGIDPRNPDNISYLGTVNAAMGLVNKVTGKATPSWAYTVPAKLSWFNAKWLNQRLGGLAGYLDTTLFNPSEFAIGINNGDGSLATTTLCRVYLGARYSQIGFGQTAVGGPINVSGSGICLQGDAANSAVSSGIGSVFAAFTAPSTDNGNAYNVSDVTFTGTDDVFSWEIMLMRPHDYQMEADGTLYGAKVNAGQPGGTFSYVTTPKSAAVPGASVVFNIGGTTSAGVKVTAYLNRDEPMESVGPRRGTKRYTYTLGDFALSNGGYPFLIQNGDGSSST